MSAQKPASTLETTINCSSLFSWTTQEQRIYIASQGTVVTLKEGDFLFRQGDQGNSLYLLTSGELEVIKDSESVTSSYVLSRCFRQGDSIGEMALADGVLRSASVRAASPSELLQVPRSLIEQLQGSSQFFPGVQNYPNCINSTIPSRKNLNSTAH